MQSLPCYWLILGGGFVWEGLHLTLDLLNLAFWSSDEFPAVRLSQLGGWEKNKGAHSKECLAWPPAATYVNTLADRGVCPGPPSC